MSTPILQLAQDALRAWSLDVATLSPITTGNINVTFFFEGAQGRFVLQRINPIFRREIHGDIAAVTAHLARKGMVTPTLVPNRDGALYIERDEGRPKPSIWRVLTYVEGQAFARAPDSRVCAEAGALLGRFHRALDDFAAPFAAPRFGVHDTLRHMAALEQSLIAHRDHRMYVDIEPLAQTLLARLRRMPQVDALRDWVVHGDAKLSNMIFGGPAGACGGVAMIDLDTLNRFPVVLELGDALRSWCNPGGEGDAEPHFDLTYFEAALRGYASQCGPLLQGAEIELLRLALELIALELGARFARDALEEAYFAWDPSRFASAAAHNLRRAHSQLTLADSYRAQLEAATALMKAAFARS